MVTAYFHSFIDQRMNVMTGMASNIVRKACEQSKINRNVKLVCGEVGTNKFYR